MFDRVLNMQHQQQKKKKKQGVRNDIYGYDMSGLVERI